MILSKKCMVIELYSPDRAKYRISLMKAEVILILQNKIIKCSYTLKRVKAFLLNEKNIFERKKALGKCKTGKSAKAFW